MTPAGLSRSAGTAVSLLRWKSGFCSTSTSRNSARKTRKCSTSFGIWGKSTGRQPGNSVSRLRKSRTVGGVPNCTSADLCLLEPSRSRWRPVMSTREHEDSEAIKPLAWLDQSEDEHETKRVPACHPTPTDKPTVGRLIVELYAERGRCVGPPIAGRYRLDRLIVEGGCGKVYRGFDLVLQRRVAVKRPKADQTEMFLIEARRAAGLQHPGIVAVHDVIQSPDGFSIVSEFIDGPDLGVHLLREPLTVREAVLITAEVA